MKQQNEESTAMQQANEECCPNFHPEKWDGKTYYWDKKKFIKESVPELFHIPYPPMIGKKVTKMMKLAEDAGQLPTDKEDILLLFMDSSPFKAELYLGVTDTVPDAENVMLSGTYMTKVFDGPPKSMPKFIKQMDEYLDETGKKAKDYYVHYAYCPKCAKEKGHNYMVLFAELEQ